MLNNAILWHIADERNRAEDLALITNITVDISSSIEQCISIMSSLAHFQKPKQRCF